MNPAFIYFDLDDTLLDHTEAEKLALRDVFHHFDLFGSCDLREVIRVYHEVNSRQWMLYSHGEVNREQLQRNRFELTLRQLDLNETHYEEIGSYYMRCYQDHWQWMSGAQPAFDSIRKEYEVGILTNGFAETQHKKFEQFNLYNQAKHLIITEEVGQLKPHPSVFDHATKLADCAAEDILYIGDSYSSDVAGGTKFGWKVAWFTENGDAEKHHKADFVFNNFDDLKMFVEV